MSLQFDKFKIFIRPRRDEIREKHNDIIHSLNERMAEKAAYVEENLNIFMFNSIFLKSENK